MLEIFKAENPRILQFIVDKFPEFKDLDIDFATKKMLLQIAEFPEQTGIFVCFEGEKIQAFVFGFLKENQIAWIDYAWSEPDLKLKYKQEVLDRFEDWAKERGKTEIRMETTRDKEKAWTRLYGMKKYAVVLRKEI